MKRQMNFKSIVAGAFVAAAFATAATAADTFDKYGTVEGWTVFKNVTDSTCLMEKVDSAKNAVQMGFTKDTNFGYVGVFTMAETGIKRGDKNAVAILLGDEIYTGEATGMRGNVTSGYTGGYVRTNNPNFVDDIMGQYTMVVFPEKEYAFTVDLKGTFKGIEMVRKCQSEM
jgi:hypothetical protein